MKRSIYLLLTVPVILGSCAPRPAPPAHPPAAETAPRSRTPDTGRALAEETGREISFRRDVLPILEELAGDCHTADNMAGNYALDSYEAVMGTGTDSVPNVIPGAPEKSLLYLYLKKGHPFGKKPDSAKLALIHDWILQGAKNN